MGTGSHDYGVWQATDCQNNPEKPLQAFTYLSHYYFESFFFSFSVILEEKNILYDLISNLATQIRASRLALALLSKYSYPDSGIQSKNKDVFHISPNKMEHTSDIYNMNKFQKHYAERKIPDNKDYMLFDYILYSLRTGKANLQ